MRACWMFLMLLSCRLSHAAKSQDSCACKDRIPIVCVPEGADVLMPCPKLTGEDMIFNLFKDDEVIYNHMCIGDRQASDCKQTRAGVTLLENTDNNSFSLTLTGVEAGSYSIYCCEGARMLPPPYVKSTLRMLLLVEGHQCNFHQDDGTPGHQHNGLLWIWILGLALLGTYSLTITITIIILVKWRRSDSERVYTNTRPKAHKDRRKKRGL